MTTAAQLVPQPRWHSAHATHVAATPERAMAAVRELRIADLPVSGALMALRAPASTRLRRDERPVLARMAAVGLVVVAEDARSVVLVLAGRPWRPRGGGAARPPRTAGEFTAFAEPGTVRVAAEIAADAEPGGARLWTQTRIAPVDEAAARAFGRYWTVVGPFSGVIRGELLRAARRRAER